MAQQLPLLDTAQREPEWRIDEQTKAIGRKGLALARAALAATATPDGADGHREHDQHRQAA
jgi:hypothetical protein